MMKVQCQPSTETPSADFDWSLPNRLRADFLHGEVAIWNTLVEAANRIEELTTALEHVVDSLGYTKNEGKSPAVRECNAHEAWKIARAALQQGAGS